MGATAVNYATCSVADYEIGDAASLLAHALLLEQVDCYYLCRCWVNYTCPGLRLWVNIQLWNRARTGTGSVALGAATFTGSTR